MSLFLININGTKCMFAHVPKCAGTAVLQGRKIQGHEDHEDYTLYTPRMRWGNWKTFPSFAIVRDPLDRFMSAWRDFRFRRGVDKCGMDHGHKIDCTPDELVDRYLLGTMEQSDYENPATVQHHLMPMTHPIHGLQHVEHLIRYDDIDKGLSEFCDRYNLGATYLSRVRESHHLSSIQPSVHVRSVVHEFYARDYELLTRR